MSSNNIIVQQWDIWLANFPYDDDPEQVKPRPVIVLSVDPLFILSVKVTKHSPRINDTFDVPITKWRESGLKYPSTARIAKSINISYENLNCKLGILHNDERVKIITAYFNYVSQRQADERAEDKDAETADELVD